MKDGITTYCHGGECPIKENCLRYKISIAIKKEDHFASIPYDFKKKKCGFFIEKHGDNLLNQIEDILKQ